MRQRKAWWGTPAGKPRDRQLLLDRGEEACHPSSARSFPSARSGDVIDDTDARLVHYRGPADAHSTAAATSELGEAAVTAMRSFKPAARKNSTSVVPRDGKARVDDRRITVLCKLGPLLMNFNHRSRSKKQSVNSSGSSLPETRAVVLIGLACICSISCWGCVLRCVKNLVRIVICFILNGMSCWHDSGKLSGVNMFAELVYMLPDTPFFGANER